ncbi:DNA-binding NtrC family response regulator [Desulfobaculum xiamenense]|uniref:DNA-binding NtrC family response regulator n=1 Tax=Desulfobaculum xiamenense TaxID=995050 RepID=A0A846QT29_9BACT|nr:response regulator [Desulfobaculum xiamenense]NJB67799.1 DNA-binding NtrC family response regulator [Desulfobaculum xiamenense]
MTQPRVLLVDDNVEFVTTLAERMQLRGLTVTAVTSGGDAIDRIEHKVFDVVVLDLRMPGMDGIETLRRIKELNDEVQIVILSGHATIELGVEAMKLGALDFVLKPVDIDLLLSKISLAQARRLILEEEHNEQKIKDILARHI